MRPTPSRRGLGACNCPVGAPRLRTLGASAAATVAEQFNLGQYVPSDVANDVNTAADYYNQFQSATSGLRFGKGGSLQLTDAQSQAVLVGMTAAVSVIPVAGQAFALLMALGPKAGAGAGVCASDPPPVAQGQIPTLAQLQSWSHFVSWASFNGAYGPDTPGTFEAFANPVLEFNWLLHANCFANLYAPPPVLLATLIAAWNATHQATSTRQICRSFAHIVSFGPDVNYDPIADALYWSIVGDPKLQGPAANTWFGAANTYNGPDQASRCFSVNAGATIVRIKPLVFHATAAQLALRSGASLAQAKVAPSSSVGTVAVLGAAAAGVWWLTTPAGARLLAKLPRLFRF